MPCSLGETLSSNKVQSFEAHILKGRPDTRSRLFNLSSGPPVCEETSLNEEEVTCTSTKSSVTMTLVPFVFFFDSNQRPLNAECLLFSGKSHHAIQQEQEVLACVLYNRSLSPF